MPLPASLFFSPSTNAAIDRYNAEARHPAPTAQAAHLAAHIREMAQANTGALIQPGNLAIAPGTLLQLASALERGVSMATVTQALATAIARSGGLSNARALAAAQATLNQIGETMFFGTPGARLQMIVNL